MEFDIKDKIEFSNHLQKFVSMYNENLNPFIDNDFKLSEISFGHGNYKIEKETEIFYFDFPYPSDEGGKIIDVVNESQRGILPTTAVINSLTYKDLDIKVANAFKNLTTDSQCYYIIYKYYPNAKTTPDIIEIKSNLKKKHFTDTDLLNYFFIIYHCSNFKNSYSLEEIFKKSPKIDTETKKSQEFEYLLYFNYTSTEHKNSQAITTAFLGGKDKFFDEIDSNCCKRIYVELFPVLETLINNPTLNYYQKQAKAEILIHATKAAISQVMARNMSHNMGSHVLSKFKNKQDIESINDTKQYSGNLPTLDRYEKIAYFNDYLKTRMDFLADVTLTTPILETPYTFCSDVLQGFLKNHILLDRISGITGDPKYKIQTRIFNCEKWYDDNLTKDKKTWNSDYFTVSMPNDVLGCHAFYIILENIIRNSYKHSKANLLEFIFTIELKEIDNPDLIEVRIYDNNLISAKEIKAKVKSRNDSFNEDLIKENRLREGSLGTIEMEVCASFLRKISLGEYEKEIYEVNENGFNLDKTEKIYNLIRAYGNICADNSNIASLGYVFYLRKPKELLIVSDTITQNEEWRKTGIDVIKSESLKSESYGHQIILSEIEIPKHITHTPRIIRFVAIEIKNRNSNDLINWAWSKYGETLVGNFHFKRSEQNCYYKTMNDNNIKVEFFPHSTNGEINSYIEASHHHTGKIKFENGNPPSSKNLVELAELALTSICIIDERIQTFYLEKTYNGEDGFSIDFKDYFPLIGINIPNKLEADLNTPNFGELETKDSVQYNLKEYLKENLNVDFIILHLGIIEKIIDKKSKETVEQKILELLDQNEESYKKIVLTSGRGTPSTIPDNCRYLPLSAVQHCVETTFDKFLLVKALYNSRKTKTN